LIHVRAATASDLVAVCTLAEDLAELHHAAAPETFAPAGEPARDEAHWLESITGRDRQGFIAEVDGRIAGFVTIGVNDVKHSLLQPKRLGHVDSICVARWARGAGVGRALMQQAERWAAGQGATELRLVVWDFNSAALRMYEALGYAVRSHAMGKPLVPEGDAG
jgi:ribosomal protein S18 acetylase RimI-like enzyme